MKKKFIVTALLLVFLSLCATLAACGEDPDANVEYTLKRLVSSNEYLGEFSVDVDSMSAEDETLYGSVLSMYGHKVTVKKIR